jgi:hypothetical protein
MRFSLSLSPRFRRLFIWAALVSLIALLAFIGVAKADEASGTMQSGVIIGEVKPSDVPANFLRDWITTAMLALVIGFDLAPTGATWYLVRRQPLSIKGWRSPRESRMA